MSLQNSKQVSDVKVLLKIGADGVGIDSIEKTGTSGIVDTYTITSTFVVPFSSCLRSFPASGFFLMSQLFTSGGQSIGASASNIPVNIQDWFPLGLTCLISLHSKGLSRVVSNMIIET